jgi:hypothetical protein
MTIVPSDVNNVRSQFLRMVSMTSIAYFIDVPAIKYQAKGAGLSEYF